MSTEKTEIELGDAVLEINVPIKVNGKEEVINLLSFPIKDIVGMMRKEMQEEKPISKKSAFQEKLEEMLKRKEGN